MKAKRKNKKKSFNKIKKVATDFRGANQRMHNKTFIVDGKVVITGGRNIADEYFDYDHEYNFRDRDVLLLGKASTTVSASFDQFWTSPLSQDVSSFISCRRDGHSLGIGLAHCSALDVAPRFVSCLVCSSKMVSLF